MKRTLCILSIVLVYSCTSSTSTAPTSNDDISPTEINPAKTRNNNNSETHALDGCYIRVTGRDTLLLQLHENGGIVNGTMHFDNYEKDSSQGTVTGKMENGKLVLWYSFDAEGMHSYSQQILQPVKDGFILGNSDIRVSNDTAYTRDLSAVEFPASNTLTRTQCSGN